MKPLETRRLATSPIALEQALASGFDPNTQDAVGDTVLHLALRVGTGTYLKSAQLLLARKDLDVAVANKKGATLLGSAVIGASRDAVKTLLDRGAKLSATENPLLWIAANQSPGAAYDAAKLIVERNLIDANRIEAAVARAKQEGNKRLIKALGGTFSAPMKPATKPRPKAR